MINYEINMKSKETKIQSILKSLNDKFGKAEKSTDNNYSNDLQYDQLIYLVLSLNDKYGKMERQLNIVKISLIYD